MYSVGLISAMITMAAPGYGQQPTDAPATDAPPSGPSADTIRRARSVGLRPEVRKGMTVYCWKDADLKTRFETKKCVDENNLLQMIEVLERQRRELQQE